MGFSHPMTCLNIRTNWSLTMSKKENIQIDDPYEVIHKKFEQSSSEALPVYSEDGFVGILEKTYTLIKYKDKIEKINKKIEGQSDLKESILHNLYHEVNTAQPDFGFYECPFGNRAER